MCCRFEPFLAAAAKKFVLQHRPTYFMEEDPNKDVHLAFFNLPAVKK